MCASLKPSLRQNLPRWRSAKNEVVLRQLVNVLTRLAGELKITRKDRGESEARQRPEVQDIAKMKEEKRMERVDGKAAGDYSFITP
jgi:hypothetical protein